MLVPVLIAAALIVGAVYGRRRTRRALQTTDGRQRHGLHPHPRPRRMVITGEVLSMDDALRTAALHRTPPPELTSWPTPAEPPTVAIPRIDGTRPVRPPRIGDSIRRGVDDAAAGRRSPRFPDQASR